MHVDLRSWEVNIFQGLFHLRLPLFHQCVIIRHVFAVIHSGWRSRLMQITYCSYPASDFFRFLICLLNRVHIHRGRTHNVLALDVLKLKDSLVLVVQRRLVQYHYTEIFLRIIRLRHFQKGVNFSNCRNVVWNERLKFGFKFDLLGFVAVDVLENVLDFLTDWQVCILRGIICAGYLLFFIVFVIISFGALGSASSLLWLAKLLSLGLLVLLLLLLYLLHIDFVVFFVRFDLFRIVHFHSQIKRLIFNFFARYSAAGSSGSSACSGLCRLGRGRALLLLLLGHSRHWLVVVTLVLLFFAVEVVSNFEGISALLGESVVFFRVCHCCFKFKFKLLI